MQTLGRLFFSLAVLLVFTNCSHKDSSDDKPYSDGRTARHWFCITDGWPVGDEEPVYGCQQASFLASDAEYEDYISSTNGTSAYCHFSLGGLNRTPGNGECPKESDPETFHKGSVTWVVTRAQVLGCLTKTYRVASEPLSIYEETSWEYHRSDKPAFTTAELDGLSSECTDKSGTVVQP
jgi:hypothetical protein